MAETLIRDSVGAALRFSRENWRFIGVVAAIGAAATAALVAIGQVAPMLSPLTGLATGVAQAFVFAAFTCVALFGAGAARGRWHNDGPRLWAAMAWIAFFLFIVFFVISIPVMIIMIVGPLAPYQSALERAGSNPSEVMSVMTRFAEEQPGAVLGLVLFYGVIWFLLTSRLYLAAPATVDQQRILAFDTWKWTKQSTLRIVGARLMLLVPANILSGALSYLVGRLAGVDPFNPPAVVSVAVLFDVFVSTFITFALYLALEAGLSSALYRVLKPATAPAPLA